MWPSMHCACKLFSARVGVIVLSFYCIPRGTCARVSSTSRGGECTSTKVHTDSSTTAHTTYTPDPDQPDEQPRDQTHPAVSSCDSPLASSPPESQ
jgi:hypothetical protein